MCFLFLVFNDRIFKVYCLLNNKKIVFLLFFFIENGYLIKSSVFLCIVCVDNVLQKINDIVFS